MPGSGQHKGIGEKKKQPELSRLPVSLFGRKSEKVIIFNVFHYILDITV